MRTMDDVTPDTIRQAHGRVQGNLNPTPIYRSQIYSKLCKCSAYLMLENIQKTGSFKVCLSVIEIWRHANPIWREIFAKTQFGCSGIVVD